MISVCTNCENYETEIQFTSCYKPICNDCLVSWIKACEANKLEINCPFCAVPLTETFISKHLKTWLSEQ